MESTKTKSILLMLSVILAIATFVLSITIWQQYRDGVKEVAQEILESPKPEEVKDTDDEVEEEVMGEAETPGLVTVEKVVDGDTIVVQGNQTIRYIGIDTPETVDPRRPVGCYGKEASNMNKKLLEGKAVRLEKDISETDKYSRLLRYIYVPTENGELFVNDYLVRQGYAKSSSYPPDIKYQQQFIEAQQEAMANNRGLWGACR